MLGKIKWQLRRIQNKWSHYDQESSPQKIPNLKYLIHKLCDNKSDWLLHIKTIFKHSFRNHASKYYSLIRLRNYNLGATVSDTWWKPASQPLKKQLLYSLYSTHN